MEKENEVTDEVIKDEVIIDSASNDETVVEDKPKVDEKISTDFDPTAFTEVPVKETEDEVIKENDEVVDEVEILDWVKDEVTEDGKKEEVIAEDSSKAETIIEDTTKVDDTPKKVSTDSFKEVASELGLKFETIEEMKEHLLTVENENNQLRKSSGSGATNESIKRLEKLKGKESTELVRLSLEKDGFKGEELDNAVDRYVDNGLIEIEAQKIRNTIDNAIVTEQNKETQSTVDADAKQQQEHKESVIKLEEHINKTDTMFGFKMSKDEDGLKNVQQAHAKYITSGKFMDDVFASEASLAEIAWFTKNKEVIIKAIANKNLQKGKAAILDDIREPEVVSPQRFRDPEGSNEFDPKKFSANK